MKIVCGSCSAKYSIADDKVAGKTFKIRCRKCGAAILVDGSSVAGSEDATTFDPGVAAVWHVVVQGEQRGPLPILQIAALLNTGEIDGEDYVWQEGFEDWKPVKDVQELAAFLRHSSAAYQVPEASRSGGSGMGADPFAGAAGVSKSSRAPSGRTGSAPGGMFGSASPSESADASSSMTGQRNENSVLFSLGNLQNLAGKSTSTGSGSSSTKSPIRAGLASGEGSGLIDIRSIAEAAKHMKEGGSTSKNDIDDLLSIGTGGGFVSTLTAPVIDTSDDDDRRSKAPMVVMISAAVIAAAAAVAVLAFMFSKTNEPAPAVAANDATMQVAPSPEGKGSPTTEVGANEAPNAQAVAANEAVPEEPDEGGEESAREGGDSDAKADAGGSRRSSRRSARSGSSSGSSPAKEASKPSNETASSTGSAGRSGGGDIDSLLEAALGGGGKKAASSGGGSSLPDTPSKSDVLSALKGVAPGVKACGAGQKGVVDAKVSVSGSTGRVTSVGISGQFAGTPVASCASRVIKRAKFPKFKQSTFVISRFPYSI